MITRIVITRASVPRVVAIASPTPSRGTRTGILGNLASSSSSSSSSSSRVPCPSPASVNSHCHRNPTQSRIPKTHYPRPSSSSSSWPRMTRAARARRARGAGLSIFGQSMRYIGLSHPWIYVHTYRYVYISLSCTCIRVSRTLAYAPEGTPDRASCPEGARLAPIDVARARVGPFDVASGGIHQSRPGQYHGTREPVETTRARTGDVTPSGFFAREVVIAVTTDDAHTATRDDDDDDGRRRRRRAR